VRNNYKDVLFGVAVGDALGVPVEFSKREDLKADPVTGMREYGVHHQPAGTWSDDSSLTFCLADTLVTHGYDVRKIARSFYDWLNDNLWTPHGFVFDIGNTTRYAIDTYPTCKTLEDYTKAGGNTIMDNGNGSLMRILPLVFHIKDLPIEERFCITKDVSSLTHGNAISVISCFYYLEFARLILKGETNEFVIYGLLESIFYLPFVKSFREEHKIELSIFDNFNGTFNIDRFGENYIKSGGFVIESLEASIWCIMNTDNYKDAVLKAVNLGSDTDTTAAIVGGLAGLLYGYETIPSEWIDVLARKKDIENLADRLMEKYEV